MVGDQLLTVLYAELRRMAQRELRRNGGLTLSPTTLLHETFLNIAQRDAMIFPDRARFMAYAARIMRGLVIDYIRNRSTQKRGSEFDFVPLTSELSDALEDSPNAGNVLADRLNEALDTLAKLDPSLAECVDLKFFCGLSFSEIAQMREVSERTVRRDWVKARVLLNRLLNESQESECHR